MTNAGFEPLYTEKEAAELLGIKERSLRTEREAGRLGFKKVAGKIMYRQRDLVAWLNLGEDTCQDATQDRTSSGSRPAGATTSPTPRTDETSAARRVKSITTRLEIKRNLPVKIRPKKIVKAKNNKLSNPVLAGQKRIRSFLPRSHWRSSRRALW